MIVAGTGLAFFFPMAFWTLRGLEVGQASLVAMACTWLAFRLESGATWPRLLGFAMLATLGMTIRIDFAAQLGIVLAYLGWQARRQGWLPRFFVLLVAVAVGVGVYAAFKVAYFGDFFPNTYYLKLTGISLLTRVKVGVATFVDVTLEDLALPVAVVLLGLLTNRGLTTPRTTLIAALFLVQCAYSVYSGGDYNEYDVRGANRFVTQGMPFIFVLTGLHASALIARGRNWTLGEGNGPAAAVPALVMAAAIVVAGSGDEWFRWGLANVPEMQKERNRVRTGLLIKASSAPSAVVAAAAAGQIPYFAERRSLDVLGKADAVIAKGPSRGEFRPGHNKWNLEHTVRDLQPDVVVMGPLAGSDQLPGWGYEKVSDEMWIRTASQSIDKERLRGPLP
jgi:hypothetical protein